MLTVSPAAAVHFGEEILICVVLLVPIVCPEVVCCSTHMVFNCLLELLSYCCGYGRGAGDSNLDCPVGSGKSSGSLLFYGVVKCVVYMF